MNYKEIINNFITNYASEMIFTILTAIASYIGILVKNLYTKYINDQTKKSVVKTVVQAVNQLYTDLHGEDKYNKAVELATSMLTEKGVNISELEIKMLIEASVNEFNKSFIGTELVEIETKNN